MSKKSHWRSRFWVIGSTLIFTLVILGLTWAIVLIQQKPTSPPDGMRKALQETRCPATPGECLSCHSKESPAVVKDWETSPHFKLNPESKKNPQRLEQVSCQACHGSQPQTLMTVAKQTCQECHTQAFSEHAASAHGQPFRLAFGSMLPPSHQGAAFKSCASCHAMQDSCQDCHTMHRFSAAEAREPESCAACHSGQDHAQYEQYITSAHGIIYGIERDPSRSPTCATCHLIKGSHNVSEGITIGGSGQGGFIGEDRSGGELVRDPASGLLMEALSEQEAGQERAKMQSVCLDCHIQNFVDHKFLIADAIKRASDRVSGQTLRKIRAVQQEGLLESWRPSDLGLSAPLLAGHDGLSGLSNLEARFYRLHKFYLVGTWKGGYHFSADWSHWLGNAPMKLELAEIDSEIRRIRKLSQLEKRISAFDR